MTFGKELETIGYGAFNNCTSLQRITIPLKDGIITHDNIFDGCDNLKHVDLVEGAILKETVTALQLEDWRNDMNAEIDAINQIILPLAPAGMKKARLIRPWIRAVVGKIVHYKIQHSRLLNEAATSLELALLPKDIVIKNVLPFLELPSYAFEGEE